MQTTSKLLQNFSNKLRTNRKPFSMATRLFSSSESKVLVERHSAALTEWKLNAPKALNSVDTEMVNLMIDELKKWRTEND